MSPITLPYASLLSPSPETSALLTQAFNTSPTSFGLLLVSDLPASFRFPELRAGLLALSEKFAALDEARREVYADPASRYSFGWSCGKEIMNGKPDTLKGSFYNNVAARGSVDDPRNIWPDEAVDGGVEGFKDTFLDLCGVMVEVGQLVARACDKVVEEAGGMASRKTVEELIKESKNSKARLLHYFPPKDQILKISTSPSTEPSLPADDSWCGSHIDHSIITGLCPAIYYFHPSPSTSPTGKLLAPLIIPSPSPSAGLYIQTRSGETIKAVIPENCLAFQTGETLSLLSSLRLAATPHFVNAAAGSDTLSPAASEVVERKKKEDPEWKDVVGGVVSRETLAVFLQPNAEEVVSTDGETFAAFTDRVLGRHY